MAEIMNYRIQMISSGRHHFFVKFKSRFFCLKFRNFSSGVLPTINSRPIIKIANLQYLFIIMLNIQNSFACYTKLKLLIRLPNWSL